MNFIIHTSMSNNWNYTSYVTILLPKVENKIAATSYLKSCRNFKNERFKFLWQQILFQVVPDLYNTKGLECIRSKEKGKEMIKKHIRWNVWVFVVDRLSYLSFYVWSKIYFTWVLNGFSFPDKLGLLILNIYVYWATSYLYNTLKFVWEKAMIRMFTRLHKILSLLISFVFSRTI